MQGDKKVLQKTIVTNRAAIFHKISDPQERDILHQGYGWPLTSAIRPLARSKSIKHILQVIDGNSIQEVSSVHPQMEPAISRTIQQSPKLIPWTEKATKEG